MRESSDKGERTQNVRTVGNLQSKFTAVDLGVFTLIARPCNYNASDLRLKGSDEVSNDSAQYAPNIYSLCYHMIKIHTVSYDESLLTLP